MRGKIDTREERGCLSAWTVNRYQLVRLLISFDFFSCAVMEYSWIGEL